MIGKVVSDMSPQVLRFHEEASSRLHELSTMVLTGAKLTLLVRRPEAPDGSQDMVVTDDDLGEVLKALLIRRSAELAQRALPSAPEATDGG